MATRTAAIATLLDGDQAGMRLSVSDDVVSGSLGRQALLDRNVAREAAGSEAGHSGRAVHPGR
jgi:hypothetical protein